MENKNVGWLIVGISGVMGAMVWIFNNLIKANLDISCSHGPTCGMYTNANIQTWISLSIVAVILIIGLVIMNTKPREKIKYKIVKEKKKPIELKGLNVREKQAIEMLQKEGGMFQKTLMEELGIGKVGMTRLLDKLEAREIVERKRRGMNNFVVLKQN
ncbi:hypothetical protein HN832_04035 [archaeon]|jgi:uncharacterized membrane protein|nr:hypothetical protein [archaeon]MBT4373436.1 hypothetical protein [archaeon]MBT4531884.1 hypothetical protein [archaeon]MBT7001551.1 hypothetical protein [archaeon]MBT7282557.1 hypothetical protein [archaeon]